MTRLDGGEVENARISIEEMKMTAVSGREIEIVERKGRGHPDSICDAVSESIAVALCREYLARFGRILHFNVDKGLLLAGQVELDFGGGRVLEPMELIVGDRATDRFDGEVVDVAEIVEKNARNWVIANLRKVDPEKHLKIRSALSPGSSELAGIFDDTGLMRANDTSAVVGYAPLTDTEKLVKKVEEFINSDGFKETHPATGEDVKVMGYRSGTRLLLTIAVPVIDAYVGREDDYWELKEAIAGEVTEYANRNRGSLESVNIEINTLDNRGDGLKGIYLTVTGTSAENGDSGEVGRGNRANGVIALNRPSGMEAAAGKNPTAHVGKIYGLLAHEIAREVYEGVGGLDEVYIWLASQIGQPVDRPRIVAAQLTLADGAVLADLKDEVERIIDFELSEARVTTFIEDLAEGRYRVW